MAKKLAALVAGIFLGAGFLVSGAQAVPLAINFQTGAANDGLLTNVGSFDESQSGSGMPTFLNGTPVTPGQPLPVGTQLQFLYQARLVGYADPLGGPITGNGRLNNTYEVTVVAILNETVAGFSIDPVTGTQTANFTLNGGTLKIFFDGTPATFSNTALGTGFDDGTLILTGSAVGGTSSFNFCPAGQPCQNFPPGPNGGQGSATTSILVGALDFDQTFFVNDPLLHDLEFTTQLLFPPGNSQTACFFCGGSGPPIGFDPVPVPPGSLLLKADASNTFSRVPEPASLVLLGLGLLTTGVAARIRSRLK